MLRGAPEDIIFMRLKINDYCSHQTRILKIDGCLCQKSQELQHLATEDENHMENGQDYGEVDFRVGKKIKIRAPPKDDCY